MMNLKIVLTLSAVLASVLVTGTASAEEPLPECVRVDDSYEGENQVEAGAYRDGATTGATAYVWFQGGNGVSAETDCTLGPIGIPGRQIVDKIRDRHVYDIYM